MKYFKIITGCAPAYHNPTFTSECVTEGIKGEICEIIDHNNDWLNLRFEDGYFGWVNEFYGEKIFESKFPRYKIIFPYNHGLFRTDLPFGSYIDDRVNGAIQIESELNLENLPNILKGLMNIPYKWGGKTSLGFDCSGLVQAVLNSIGLKIPRDSKEQYKFFKNNKINIENSKFGDLHFFTENNKICHVGFSTGGKGIIHCQGYVKKESLKKDDVNYNKNLLDKYLSTHSIRSKFN